MKQLASFSHNLQCMVNTADISQIVPACELIVTTTETKYINDGTGRPMRSPDFECFRFLADKNGISTLISALTECLNELESLSSILPEGSKSDTPNPRSPHD